MLYYCHSQRRLDVCGSVSTLLAHSGAIYIEHSFFRQSKIICYNYDLVYTEVGACQQCAKYKNTMLVSVPFQP